MRAGSRDEKVTRIHTFEVSGLENTDMKHKLLFVVALYILSSKINITSPLRSFPFADSITIDLKLNRQLFFKLYFCAHKYNSKLFCKWVKIKVLYFDFYLSFFRSRFRLKEWEVQSSSKVTKKYALAHHCSILKIQLICYLLIIPWA